MATKQSKTDFIYKMETNLPMAGNGKSYTKREWKRIYGYEIGLVAGVKFIKQ